MSKTVIVKLTKSGANIGPFKISDEYGTILEQDISKDRLINGIGYTINDSVSVIILESTGDIKLTKTIHDILDKEKQEDKYYYPETHPYYPELAKTMTKKDTVYQWRRVYVRENKSNVCPTLTANMGAGGHNVPLIKDDFGIRKLTPKECFAFQGYPMDKYILPPVANSKLYMQAGNSVTTPLIERISNEIIKVL